MSSADVWLNDEFSQRPLTSLREHHCANEVISRLFFAGLPPEGEKQTPVYFHIVQEEGDPMLKLNVGFTKKVGEANYGSRGAAVNLELELDSSLVGDADRLKDRIRQLFGLAKASVDEELAVATSAQTGSSYAAHEHDGHQANGNGGANSHGNSRHGTRRRDGTRAATASQQRALVAIAERQGIVLADKLNATYGVRDPAELTITEASSLIDELKSATGNGRGGGR